MRGTPPPDIEPVAWSRRHTAVFVATVAALALLPWTVAHWPSQDGPNHLAVAHVLMHYADRGSPFPKYLDVETGFWPSTALYAVLGFLARGMSLPSAEKVLVSLAIVLLPSSLLLLVRRALPRRSVNVLLALPFVVGWGFGMGFLSFLLAMGLGVLTLALAWEAPRQEQRAHRAFFHGLAAVAYFLSVWFHPVAALIAGLGLLLLEGPALRRPAAWLRVVAIVAPAALFLVGSYLAARAPAGPSASPGETSMASPLTVVGGLFEYHFAYSPLELVPRLVAMVLLVRFAYRGMRAYSPLGPTAEGAVARVELVFLLLYCVTPIALQGWFYSSTRFLLFATLLLPAVAEIPPRIGRRLLVLAPALTVAVLAVQWPNLRSTSRQLQDILDVGASLAPGDRLVPMDFSARLLGPQPLEHGWAELVVARDAIAPQLFAAGKPRMGGEHFRTLGFRPGLLDEAGGALPWSSYEGWYDVVRKCSSGSFLAWFVARPAGCQELLAERTATLDAVVDRYDYVLMLDPPDYGASLVAAHAELVDHRGSAWMYRVLASHQGQGRSYSRSH
ncbi:MAG TPA: hypothetical protein VGL81_18100 [Polyangiaceae bacterium]|jgi:hypothetical protein